MKELDIKLMESNNDIEILLDSNIELPIAVTTKAEPKIKKPRKKKEIIIPVSPYKLEEPIKYYGSAPTLVKWKDWLLICSLVRGSQTFKDLYKKENFKWGDIEESGYIYPVYTKEPIEIKNLDGKVIETIPGVYNEDLTYVLPPKFIFAIYRRYLLSQQNLGEYIQKIEQLEFTGYGYETLFPPRDEQVELAAIAKESLTTRKYLNGIIQCPPGWGKGVFNDTLIETPSGNLRMGDIKVNDIIFGKNGKPTKVKEVYPQGIMDLYKFTFGDNTTTLVDESHLWEVWDTDNKKWRTLSTKEILSKNYTRPEKDKRYGDKSNGMRYKYFIPLCEPVEYIFDISDRSKNRGLSPLQHCIHPYALGLMLGDGSFRPKCNSFNFADKFRKNIEKLRETLLMNGYIDDITFDPTPDNSGAHNFRSKKLKELSKIFGLDGKYSIEKHIPYEYLHASVESRKLLLEGLIATDGYVRTKSSWSYSTSSPQLKEDVCKLARSLGYYVTIKINKNNSYVHKGEKLVSENTNWEICINYEKKRKAITDIESFGQGETTCIKVEAEDSLFLINDFIVTHNTFISINIGSMIKGQVMIVVPNNLLKEQWIDAITEFTNLTEDDIGIIHGSDITKLTKKGQMEKPILICLIQSLDSQLKRIAPNELIDFYRNVAAVFYDETHTSGAADGYAKTTGIFTTFNIIGLSATPYKKDKNLFQLYSGIGTIFYISTHQNLIPACNMHLLPIGITEKERRNLYDIFEKTNYNFFMSQLEDFLFKDHYYFVYLTEWILYRWSQGYSSVILFKTNKMLEKLDTYIAEKIKNDREALGIEPDQNKKEIKVVILTNATAKTNKKEISTSDVVLSNYKMFSAGADFPHLSCVFFASMVLGKIPIIQTLGRVTRKNAEKNQEVQAHFLIPKFIYPLYSNNEPHLTITRAVKLQYPEAQFKWDKGFTDYFAEKKEAATDLVSENYKNFQNNNTGNMEISGTRNNGCYMIDANYSNTNRLSNYIAGNQADNQLDNGMPIPPNAISIPGMSN